MKVAGLDDGDDVVWRREASYVDGNGRVQFLIRFLTRSEEAALLAAFGRTWLDRYLEAKALEVEQFGKRGVH